MPRLDPGVWGYRAAVLGVVLGIFVLPNSGRSAVLALLAATLTYEIAHLAMSRGCSGALGCWQGLQWWILMQLACDPGLLALISLLTMYVGALVLLYGRESQSYNSAAVITASGAATVSVALACASRLLTDEGSGVRVLLVALGTVATQDFASAVIGREWSAGRLAPLVSPRKSVSGAVGGAFCAMAVGLTIMWLRGVRLPWLTVPGFVMAAIVGDLVFSSVKRSFGVKDFGAVFGRKGGFLDRADSALFAAILAYLVWLPRGWHG